MAQTCGCTAWVESDAGGVLPDAGLGSWLFFQVEAQARCAGCGSEFIGEPINAIGAAGGEGGARVGATHRIEVGTDIDAPEAS
jgi:hypothetical protein